MKRSVSNRNKLDISLAFADLACLYPGGELQASMSAVSFLQMVVEDISTLRVALSTAVAIAEKGETPKPGTVKLWRTTSAFLAD